jgi:hypothetical protein
MDHIIGLLKKWTKKMLKMNAEDNEYHKIQDKLENQESLETMFPEDLFGFFNQQINILGEKLKGDVFLNVVSLWMNHLQDMLEEKVDNLIKHVKDDEILRYPVEINDYNKLTIHLNDTKNNLNSYLEGELIERSTQLFKETSKLIGKNLEKMIEQMVLHMFKKIEQLAVEELFKYTRS